MSQRLSLPLLAGIETLQVREGRIVDGRYLPSPAVGRLEAGEWQELEVPCPAPPFSPSEPPSARGEEETRLALIAQSLHYRRRGATLQAHEVLYWNREPFPQVLGFIVQAAPDLDWVGFALADLGQKFAEPGYAALPLFQGRYRCIFPDLPHALQRLQREYWAYPSFSDHASVFLHLLLPVRVDRIVPPGDGFRAGQADAGMGVTVAREEKDVLKPSRFGTGDSLSAKRRF